MTTPLITVCVLDLGSGGSYRPIGWGDLEIVRQDLQRYEAGEVAHIENVLQKESKERTHRRLKRTEETYLTETETISETEKDLQSSDRFELQRETQETIEENSKFAVDVTLKYGGFVDVTANTQYSTEDSSERSARGASSYAREVMERSVSRIQERVREQRVRTTIEEFEETNVHGVNNKEGEDHIVGIYRWVNKVYKAQIYNYGRRLMFEFIVPEPGAFTLFSQARDAREGLGMDEPKEPMRGPLELVWDWQANEWAWKKVPEEPLRPHHIQWWNYQQWVAQYKVGDVQPPPPRYVKEVFCWQTPALDGNVDAAKSSVWEGTTSKISFDDGYAPTRAYVYIEQLGHEATSDHGIGTRKDTVVLVSVSDRFTWYNGYFPNIHARSHVDLNNFALNKISGEVPISIAAIHANKVSVVVEVLGERTDDALDRWRHKTYEAIMTAYLNSKSQYEEQVAAASVEEGIAISGRNPELNRQLEQNELKKGTLTLLTENVGDTGAIYLGTGSVNAGYPEIQFYNAANAAPYIQYFEQAFEWDQMMYVLYPYFWARKELWPVLQQIQDDDPLHAQFLQAGAARVLVPVRPKYEESVLFYLEGGEPWKKPDAFKITSPLYVSLVDAIREQHGIDYTKREGAITVNKADKTVTGTGTKFTDDDKDREIVIKMIKYRIAAVDVDNQELTLTEKYHGESEADLPYCIGLKMVDEPWEVTIPTSLVYLEQPKVQLPDFTEESS